jgi:hypothetical protein
MPKFLLQSRWRIRKSNKCKQKVLYGDLTYTYSDLSHDFVLNKNMQIHFASMRPLYITTLLFLHMRIYCDLESFKSLSITFNCIKASSNKTQTSLVL